VFSSIGRMSSAAIRVFDIVGVMGLECFLVIYIDLGLVSLVSVKSMLAAVSLQRYRGGFGVLEVVKNV